MPVARHRSPDLKWSFELPDRLNGLLCWRTDGQAELMDRTVKDAAVRLSITTLWKASQLTCRLSSPATANSSELRAQPVNGSFQ